MAARRKLNEPVGQAQQQTGWADLPTDVLRHMGPFLGPGQRASLGETERRIEGLYSRVLPGITVAQASLRAPDGNRWVQRDLQTHFMGKYAAGQGEKLPAAFKIVRDCVLSRETFIIATRSDHAIELRFGVGNFSMPGDAFLGALVYARGAFKSQRNGQYERYTPDAPSRWFRFAPYRSPTSLAVNEHQPLDLTSLDGSLLFEHGDAVTFDERGHAVSDAGTSPVDRYGPTTMVYALAPGQELRVSGPSAKSGPHSINPRLDLRWRRLHGYADPALVPGNIIQIKWTDESEWPPVTHSRVFQITTGVHALTLRSNGVRPRMTEYVDLPAIIFGARLGYEHTTPTGPNDAEVERDYLVDENQFERVPRYITLTNRDHFQWNSALPFPERLGQLGQAPWTSANLRGFLGDAEIPEGEGYSEHRRAKYFPYPESQWLPIADDVLVADGVRLESTEEASDDESTSASQQSGGQQSDSHGGQSDDDEADEQMDQ